MRRYIALPLVPLVSFGIYYRNAEYKYCLRSWINEEELNHYRLSANPYAGFWLTQNPKKIKWQYLSGNPSEEAVDMLLSSPHNIWWEHFSKNTNRRAVEFLDLPQNFDKINWKSLSKNSAAIHILLKNPEKICGTEFAKNTAPGAIKFIRENKPILSGLADQWENVQSRPFSGSRSDILRELSANPEAVVFLQENPSLIDYRGLSRNPNPDAIEILRQNPEKIRWIELSSNTNPAAMYLIKIYSGRNHCEFWIPLSANPAASHLILQNPEQVFWNGLSSNPNPVVFELLLRDPHRIDYDNLSENPAIFHLSKKYIFTTKWWWPAK